MTTSIRALLGFLAAALSVLTFHQGMWGLLYLAGWMARPPYPLNPSGPLGVPLLLNFCFWAGLYGMVYGLALPRLVRMPGWLSGLLLGLLAALVGWFVVAPLKGQPVAGGFDPTRMLISVLINGIWGVGVGIILSMLLPKAAQSRLASLRR